MLQMFVIWSESSAFPQPDCTQTQTQKAAGSSAVAHLPRDSTAPFPLMKRTNK